MEHQLRPPRGFVDIFNPFSLKNLESHTVITPSWNGTVGAYFLTRQIWLQIIKLGLLCDGKNLILKNFGKPI